MLKEFDRFSELLGTTTQLAKNLKKYLFEVYGIHSDTVQFHSLQFNLERAEDYFTEFHTAFHKGLLNKNKD